MPPKGKKLSDDADRAADGVGEDGRAVAGGGGREDGEAGARAKSPRRTGSGGRSSRWRKPAARRGRRPGWARMTHRPVRFREARRREGLQPAPPADAAAAHPPRLLSISPACRRRRRRVARVCPAANAIAGRVREARRSAARQPALRRALGAALARPRALRGERRLPHRRLPPERLALSRLRHPRASTPTSRTTGSCRSRSPATNSCPDDPDALIATGYLRHWIYEYNNRDVRGAVDERSSTTSPTRRRTSSSGMGMQCARCHDHKFDPILQKDYFRLQAFFAPMLPRDDLTLATPEQEAAYRGEAGGVGGEDGGAPRADRRDRSAVSREGGGRRDRRSSPGDIRR